MNKIIYVTVAGAGDKYGLMPFEVGRVFGIAKTRVTPENSERIVVVPENGTSICGYIANTPQEVIRGTYSGGRIYDLFERRAEIRVCFICEAGVVCQLIQPSKVVPVTEVFEHMCQRKAGNIAAINHFSKVYAHASMIGAAEGLDRHNRYILCIAALTHDIGAKADADKQGGDSGRIEEEEGPLVARAMLEQLGVEENVISRVCFLIGHHHTLDGVDGLDWQVLVEAELLADIEEQGIDMVGIAGIRKVHFKTKAGIRLLDAMFTTDKIG